MLVGSYSPDSFHGSDLCRYFIAVPGISCLRSIEISAHFRSCKHIFLHRLQQQFGLPLLSVCMHDDRQQGFFVNGTFSRTVGQPGQEVSIDFLISLFPCRFVQSTDIKVFHNLLIRTYLNVVFPLLYAHLFINLLHLFSQISQCTSILCFHSVRQGNIHCFQTSHQFHCLSGDVTAAFHSLIPAPGSVRQLKCPQLVRSLLQTGTHAVQIKQQGYAPFLLSLISSFSHPGCFGQQQIFQITVFLQIAHQCFLIFSGLLPGFKYTADSRIGVHQHTGKPVGIICRCPGHSIIG